MRGEKRTVARIKELIRSRFFVILIAVAVFLTVLPTALAMMGRADIVRSGANAIAYPFRELARVTGDAFKGFSAYFTEFDRLKEENERLKEELEAANGRLDSAEIAIAENIKIIVKAILHLQPILYLVYHFAS